MIKEINESKFNMWRAIVALVHADGIKHPKEDQFLLEAFNKLPLNSKQVETLKQDMIKVQNVDEYFDKITEPSDRSHFIYFARLLFWSDGDFHKQESEILNHFHKKTLEKVHLEKIMHSVDSIAEEYDSKEKEKGFRQILADFIERFFA
ncbi:MAG: TerB family tellurite resistance protein [Bdellovibrionaceae bacterium]|nr:TerB family tellurite resistance protein [Pseudobdellovibrionaceae bacterium]